MREVSHLHRERRRAGLAVFQDRETVKLAGHRAATSIGSSLPRPYVVTWMLAAAHRHAYN
jgi:hypothetical protein